MRNALIGSKVSGKAFLMVAALCVGGVVVTSGCQNQSGQNEQAKRLNEYPANAYEQLSKESVIRPVQYSMKVHTGSSGALLPVNLETQLAPLLDQFAEWDKVTRVTVTGHTDAEGSDISNMRLSLKRAQALADRLIAEGIAAEMIEVTGRGEEAPIASNTSITGKQLNRRIEVIAYGLVEEPLQQVAQQ